MKIIKQPFNNRRIFISYVHNNKMAKIIFCWEATWRSQSLHTLLLSLPFSMRDHDQWIGVFPPDSYYHFIQFQLPFFFCLCMILFNLPRYLYIGGKTMVIELYSNYDKQLGHCILACQQRNAFLWTTILVPDNTVAYSPQGKKIMNERHLRLFVSLF